MKWLFCEVRPIFLFFSAFFLLFDTLSAQNSFQNIIKREFETTAENLTKISTRYGKIEVLGWAENKVTFNIYITVQANSESAAKKVFDRINADFSTALNFVKATTTIAPEPKQIWNFKDQSSKSNFSIDYQIRIPYQNSLEIDMYQGDVDIEDFRGKVDIILKHGKLNIQEAGQNSRLTLAYASGIVGQIQDLTADITRSKIEFHSAEALRIFSNNSTIRVDKAEELRCNTKYDDYTIQYAKDFKNNGKYDIVTAGILDNAEIRSCCGTFKIDQLTKNLQVDTEKGTITVLKVAKGFSELNLLGHETDFLINVSPDASFQLDGKAEYAGIKYPREMEVKSERETSSTHDVKAILDKGYQFGKIIARLSYGALKLTRK